MRRVRRVAEREALIFTPLFPYNTHKPIPKRFRHDVVIGVGGNIGDTVRRFERLMVYLRRHRTLLRVVASSPIYRNPPFGYVQQPDFYNATLHLKTTMAPQRLLRFCMETERRFGRKRSFKDAPRTLDLDILFYDTRVIKRDDLKIPHPQWHKRPSVTVPLGLMGARWRR